MSLARYLKPASILFTSKSNQTSLFVRSIHTTPVMSASVEDGHPPKSRSTARIPGPVEQSMQTKVCTLLLFYLLFFSLIPSFSPSQTRSQSKWNLICGVYKWNTNDQLVEAFTPTLIRISNDSSKHAHHTAMRAIGGGGGETRKSKAVRPSSLFRRIP